MSSICEVPLLAMNNATDDWELELVVPVKSILYVVGSILSFTAYVLGPSD
jgi:hypothetical protein